MAYKLMPTSQLQKIAAAIIVIVLAYVGSMLFELKNPEVLELAEKVNKIEKRVSKVESSIVDIEEADKIIRAESRAQFSTIESLLKDMEDAGESRFKDAKDAGESRFSAMAGLIERLRIEHIKDRAERTKDRVKAAKNEANIKHNGERLKEYRSYERRK